MHGFLSFLPRSSVKFVVTSNLSTCDTTRLQFLRTPPYFKVVLASPPPSPHPPPTYPFTNSRQQPGPPVVLPAGPRSRSPAVSGCACSDTNSRQQPSDPPPLSKQGSKQRGGITVKLKEKETRIRLGPRPRKSSTGPSRSCPGLHPRLVTTPPPPTFPTSSSTRIRADRSRALLVPLRTFSRGC